LLILLDDILHCIIQLYGKMRKPKEGTNMDFKEAIDVIKDNYPPEQYIIFRKALDLATVALEDKIISDNKAKLFKEKGIRFIEVD